MAFARWQATITDGAGNIVPNAQVEVRQEIAGSPLARLYSDRQGTIPASNPIAADAKGYVFFHVTGGAYRITATKGAFSREWRYVGIGRNSESDLAGLRPQGAWDADHSYSSSDYIRHNGRTFVSLVDENVGHMPPDAPADSEVWMWVPLGENAELAIEAREEAEAQARHAEEWAQSANPISVPAGGDGATDKSAKAWAGVAEDEADRSADEADRSESAANVASGAMSAVVLAENTFATKATAEAFAPVAAPDYIRTAGYWASGDGGGALYRNVGSEPVHAGKLSITLSGGKVVWYELASSTITPFMFGAKGDGAYDDGPALNAMFAFAASINRSVDATGNFRSSIPIIVGFTSGSSAPASRDYKGYMQVTATTAIPVLVRLRNLSSGSWKGMIRVIGTGGASFSSRTCDVGVALENCGRMHIDQVYATNFRHSGFQTSVDGVGGSTGASVNSIRTIFCGSGHNTASMSLGGNWNTPVNSGTSGSAGQRTSIVVDTLPPSYVFLYGSITLQPVYVRISGQLYQVVSYDSGSSTLSLGPWLDPTDVAAGSGTFQYIFGAGVFLQGANNNVLNIGETDSSDCGVGLRMGSLYGSTIGSALEQSCGIGLWYGTNNGNSAIGHNIAYYYAENNGLDIVYQTGGVNWGQIGITNEGFSWSKVLSFGRARTTGQIGPPPSSLSQLAINYRGAPLSFEKGSNPATPIGNALANIGPAKPLIMAFNSGSIALPTLDTNLFSLYGYDSKLVTFIGTGTNKAPTGTFTFTPPAGQTVNGGASAAFAGFTGPAAFVMQYNFTTLDWTVVLTGGRERAPMPPTIIATNANANITPWTTSEIVRHTGTLTADRTLTLLTTNAVAGLTFKITRTGAGAFNLSVGGLKNLAQNTWCEVVFDGSAYVLAAYGTL